MIADLDLHDLYARELFERPGPIPDFRLEGILQGRDMSFVARSPDSTTSSGDSTISCGPDDTTGACERPTSANPITRTVPVVLGVVLPLSFAFILLVVLHRRHVKKLRREDAEDKHKSLDFGMGGAVVEKKKRGKAAKKGPEMSSMDAYDPGKKDRGLSLDLSLANPYLLPPELQQSRESLHSLSRTIHTDDDKYRATNFIPDDGSLRSPSSLRHRDDASIYTYSSRHRTETESTRGLLPNIHGLSHEPVPIIQKPIPAARNDNKSLLAPTALDASRESYMSTTSSNGHIAAMRASNNYLGQFISGGARNAELEKKQVADTAAELEANSSHDEPRHPPVVVFKDETSKRSSVVPGAAGFEFNIPPNTYELSSGYESTLPEVNVTAAEKPASEVHEAPGHEVSTQQHFQPIAGSALELPQESTRVHRRRNTPDIQTTAKHDDESDYYDEEIEEPYDIDEYKETLGYDPRLLTMGMRPLPPDDPMENPEERAIRIRSFYKEYFEDTAKPGGDKARLSYFDGSENYVDDYYGSNDQTPYGHGSYGYGPHAYSSNGYPPRGYGSRVPSVMSARGPPGRHRATVSNGSFMSGGPGPRAYSSASQRLPGQRMRFAPKVKLPPPEPLQVLPNPARLKDDSMLPNAIDYAPPQVFKNQRSGTPDGPRGGLRPYSPSTRAYNPLVSSFDDLSVLPSPHQLRKSGTFSTLDFAPPRFAAPATGSDSGSIRSNRSGMSAMQLQNIRSGAYRLSRIPKEVAGTKDELAHALKPQWNAR